MTIELEQRVEFIHTGESGNIKYTQLKQVLATDKLIWIPCKQMVKKTVFPYAIFRYEAIVKDKSVTRNELIDMIWEKAEEVRLKEDSWI